MNYKIIANPQDTTFHLDSLGSDYDEFETCAKEYAKRYHPSVKTTVAVDTSSKEYLRPTFEEII